MEVGGEGDVTVICRSLNTLRLLGRYNFGPTLRVGGHSSGAV